MVEVVDEKFFICFFIIKKHLFDKDVNDFLVYQQVYPLLTNRLSTNSGNLRINSDKIRMYEKGVVDKLWKRNDMMKQNCKRQPNH